MAGSWLRIVITLARFSSIKAQYFKGGRLVNGLKSPGSKYTLADKSVNALEPQTRHFNLWAN
jgi:hypothetical protein